jgi:hypothetical protein
MKEIAPKKPIENHRRQNIAGYRSASKPTYPSSFLNYDNVRIQRTPICSCDSSCPHYTRGIQPKFKIGQPDDINEQEEVASDIETRINALKVRWPDVI